MSMANKFIITLFVLLQSIPIFSSCQFLTRTNVGNRFDVFQLPDSTLVQLDLGSTLTYRPFHFLEDSVRLVELHGRAFFSVIRDTEKPFVVLIDSSVVITNRGDFNVNTFDVEDVRVDVFLGRVTLETKNDEAVTSGVRSLVSQHGMIETTFDDNTAFASDWRIGVYNFFKSPPQKIISCLNKFPDLNIIEDNKPSTIKLFTICFSSYISYEEIIKKLKQSNIIKHFFLDQGGNYHVGY